MGKIETDFESVVANVEEYDEHYEISGLIHVRFNGKTHEIDFQKTINKKG